MSFPQKSSLATVVALVAVYGCYFAVVGVRLDGDVEAVAYKPFLVLTVVALAVLMLCFAVGGTGALLSAATGSRATLPTIGLSCAVIVVIFLMFGLCMVVGALAATLLIAVGA